VERSNSAEPLLDTDMEPLLAELGIHRLIRVARDSRPKPVVLLKLVAGRALTTVQL
jgi:hypothetical protein